MVLALTVSDPNARMPPPIPPPAELPVSVLPVTVVTPPSLAMAPPALPLVLLVNWVPVTTRRSLAVGGRPAEGLSGPLTQRRSSGQPGRRLRAALCALAGWPFWPLRIPPPSPPPELSLTVLPVTVTRPPTFCRPPFWMPAPP